MKAGVVHVFLCVSASVHNVCPSTVHVHIKRDENKGSMVYAENTQQC